MAGFPAPAHAQSADVLAQKLVALRADVEGLSADLTETKTDARNELQSLARQKAELEVELEREQMRAAKLRAAFGKKTTTLTELSSAGDELAPIYDKALAGMRGYVEHSLPFRRDERLAELDKIDEQRRTGVLTYPRALVRVWSFVEDELRMTRENAAFQQTITLGTDEQLSNVVRIGMVMMFFATDDGTYGYTRKQPDGSWQFVEATSKDERRQIRTLFDNFKKQIRVGLFVLPNAVPPVTR